MISRNRIKFIASLQQKKHREEAGLFVVEGEKLVLELIQSGWEIDTICATADLADFYKMHNENLSIEAVSEEELQRMSGLTTPNKTLAVVPIPEPDKADFPAEKRLILALDEVRDPGNLGTIIRLADWFGIGQILCSKGTVELYNPKTVQASMGSLFRVRACYGTMDEMLKQGKQHGYRINAAVLDGINIYGIQNFEKEILLLGNEAHGIGSAILALADRKISIPPHPRWSGAESLNVSMATAILCSEFTRADLLPYSK
ncbi:MAG: RNA methyltransferase [Bacteroidales bacterium]